MNPEKIGKFICELRKEKNLSQYQLADMIPISRQGVSKWERGVTTPDTQTLIQLSELFHVSIDELLRGERSENNTIEKLEETTLSILDQSNKKTKTIKRITTTSISIIAILLLAFLSYYFINSYNTTEVYKIGNTNDKFTTYEGILITTREKYYLKLGKIKNKIDAKINNIKLIYKKGNKSITLVEDQEADNIVIMESYGYGEKFTKRDIDNLKNHLYIEIDYNETEKVVFKIRCERDYRNSSLFFLNQKTGKSEKAMKEISKQEESTKDEEKKVDEVKDEQEETKPTIQETASKQTTGIKETPTIEESTTTEPQETIITTEMVINKIKEICDNTNGAYTCEYDNSNIIVTYHSIMSKITLYKDGNLIGHYFATQDNYMCTVDNCETIFDTIYKEYLFS